MLNAVIDFTPGSVILDPFAGNTMVAKGLQAPGCKIVLNDYCGRKDANMHYEPLESRLYHEIYHRMGRLDAIVMAPPTLLLELALGTALEFASEVVCVLIPDAWFTWYEMKSARGQFLAKLRHAGRLFDVQDHERGFDHWLIIFASREVRERMLKPGMDSEDDRAILKWITGKPKRHSEHRSKQIWGSNISRHKHW
jgi:hypothetical protein